MRRWPFIFIGLLAALLGGCASGPKPFPQTACNDAGDQVAMADPYLGQWTYQLDYAGRLRVQTDGRGDVIKLFYTTAGGTQDPLGRVQRKEIYSLNETNQTLIPVFTNTYVYDNSDDGNFTVYPGLLYKTTDSEGWEKNGYDSRGRLVKTARHLNILNRDYTNSYTYNDGDYVTSITYPNSGPTITNAYFHGGSLNQVSLGGSGYHYYTASAASFDPFDHATNFIYGNGLTTTRSFYPVSERLQKISAGSVFSRSFTYTAGSDIASLSGTGLVSTVNVTYDNLHRIKTYTGLSGSYGYTAAGTLSNSIEGGGSTFAFGVRRPQAVKSAFGYVYLYDLCGNMIVRHGGATNSQALVYDAENRLVRVAQASTNFLLVRFGYAGDGTRLWKWNNQSPTNLQVWIGNTYEEKNGKTLFHVFANGEQVCTFEAGSPLDGGSDTNKVGYYYTEDNLNSSSALSDSVGNQIEVDAYYPFGSTEMASPQANFQVSRRFTGQIFDAELGLYWYNSRIYVPELGRFGQADTVISDLSNPQSYNRYSYVENCPLRYNDPTGHYGVSDWWSDTKAGFGIVENSVGNFLNNTFVTTKVTVDPHMTYAGTGTVTPITENGKDITAKLILQVATLPLTAVTMGPEREGAGLVKEGASILKNAGKESGAIKEGIYSFKEGEATYIGQSGNIPKRLATHEATGKKALEVEAQVTEVSGGKTAREIAEHKRIQEVTGGVPARESSKVTNQRDPIGPNRQELLKDNP